MAEYIEAEVDGETYKITAEIAKKYGERVVLSPADHQKKVLSPITDKEWQSFSVTIPSINGVPISGFESIARPILDAFLSYRAKSLK